MKTISLLILLSASPSLAEQYCYAFDPTPFRCEKIQKKQAEQELARICETQGLQTTNIHLECRFTSDDGGYVNYYSLQVCGECR